MHLRHVSGRFRWMLAYDGNWLRGRDVVTGSPVVGLGDRVEVLGEDLFTA